MLPFFLTVKRNIHLQRGLNVHVYHYMDSRAVRQRPLSDCTLTLTLPKQCQWK